jgi:hypothetical protein
LDVQGASVNLIDGEIDFEANVNTASPVGSTADWSVDNLTVANGLTGMTSGCVLDLGQAHTYNQTTVKITTANGPGATMSSVGVNTKNFINTPVTGTGDTTLDLPYVNESYAGVSYLTVMTYDVSGSGGWKTGMYAHK